MATTNAIPGQVLTGNVGLWVNGVTGYAYQLLRNGVTFQSGVWGPGVTYTVQASDSGSVISINVIASNSSGSGLPAHSMGVVINFANELGLVNGTDTLGLVNQIDTLGDAL